MKSVGFIVHGNVFLVVFLPDGGCVLESKHVTQ